MTQNNLKSQIKASATAMMYVMVPAWLTFKAIHCRYAQSCGIGKVNRIEE